MAVASHSFTDVPDLHTFHEDIAWLKDNNITFGCNPPANTEFCPEDNVTRGEMAAFLHRFANNVAGEDGVVGPAGPAGPQGPAGPAGQGVNNFNFGDTYCTSVAGTPTFNCYEFVSPSSNAENKDKGWAYYSIDGSTITYTSTRAFASCFETRFDGEANTAAGTNPNTFILDGLWVENCVTNGQQTREIPAGTSLVEIRMVYGAEGDERFNWEVNLMP